MKLGVHGQFRVFGLKIWGLGPPDQYDGSSKSDRTHITVPLAAAVATKLTSVWTQVTEELKFCGNWPQTARLAVTSRHIMTAVTEPGAGLSSSNQSSWRHMHGSATICAGVHLISFRVSVRRRQFSYLLQRLLLY